MLIWLGTIAFIIALLVVDLTIFHRAEREMSFREAMTWVFVWIAVGLGFNAFVYGLYASQWLGFGAEPPHALSAGDAAILFFTGYVIEYSLSVDNIFVIAIILTYFHIPLRHQHRVLFWGIVGAIVMRGGMIAAGTALLRSFEWMNYVFGAILIVTAARLMFISEEKMRLDRNLVVRIVRRLWRVSSDTETGRFLVREQGRAAVTPAFLALLVINFIDIVFAVDSVPAVLGLRPDPDPYIAFTSNMFAVLGLRALYFVLAGAMGRFRYLKGSLVILLAFIGVKMMLGHHFNPPMWVSLAIIAGILSGGIAASLMAGPQVHAAAPGKPAETPAPGSDLEPAPDER
jgi:tellurite resistance protein TerC